MELRRRLVTVLAGLVLSLVVPAGLAVPASAASPRPVPTTARPSPEPDLGGGRLRHSIPCTYADTFRGLSYCGATVEQVKATQFGFGKRVFLGQGIVYDAGSDGIGIAQQRGPICDEGTCDFYLVSVLVPWTLADRPGEGDVIDLYGTTTRGSLEPVGYQIVGFCDDPYDEFC